MRKITSVFLTIILCSFLFSCHGGLDTTGNTGNVVGDISEINFVIPDSFDESKNYEITFWAKNDSNLTQADIYRKAIADFQEIYPNITVKLRLYTDYGRIYNDVITNLATDTTPNVCITYPDHIATYITGKDTVLPLDSLMRDEKYGLAGSKVKFDSPKEEEIVKKFLDECLFDSYHYALPFMRSTEACYINKTYVEKLGYTLPDVLTWDFIFEVSNAATEKDVNGKYKLNGDDVLIPFIYKSSDNMMIQMLRQMNAPYSDNDGNIYIFNDATRKILLNISESAKSGAFSTFKISSYPANFLNRGQCIFAIDSTAGATWMGSKAPLMDISEDEIVSFETAILPVPQYDTDNISMISQGPSICIFNKEDNGEVLASWLFTQYLLTNDIQLAYAETEGYLPVTTKAQNSEQYKDYLSKSDMDSEQYYKIKIDASKLLLDNLENTFVTPVFNGSASLRNAAGQMIEEVTKGARRGKTIDDAFITALYSDMSSLYHLELSEENSFPISSKVLILSLLGVWVLIFVYFILQRVKFWKKRHK